jgi:hypothetical protein
MPKKSFAPFLCLLTFGLLAYLPVLLPFFHVKNDLVTQNLPTRFFISESLHSGCFPWWNPYINFGIPQYGDMNNGYWNPILWLIAPTAGYGIWAITLEEVFYILLGGCGIWLICRQQRTSPATAFLTAASYMACGFIQGHLQHFCWITGTAYFPFVLLYFIRIHKNPVWKNFIGGGISTALFLSATHPGLIIGALYFFAFLHLGIWMLRKDALRPFYHRRFWAVSGIFLAVSVLLSLVIIVSDIDVLGHISRGQKVSLDEALMTPTTAPSYLSLLFPIAVQRSSIFQTDLAMRNTYIGLALLAGLLLFFRYAGKRLRLYTLSMLGFFLLLAGGGWFKTLAYYTLPFTGYVRMNGEFSYFVTLIMLLAGAWGLETYFRSPRQPTPDHSRRLFRLAGVCGGLTFLSIVIILITHASFAYHDFTPAPADWKQTIKTLITEASFWDLLALGALVQGLTLLFLAQSGFTRPMAGRSRSTAILILAANAIITCWLILPFTGLGMASKADRQDLINTFPKGIHVQEQVPLKHTRFLDSSYYRDLYLFGSYSKKIGYPKEEDYPVEVSTTRDFFRDQARLDFIRNQSFIFLSTDTTTTAATCFDSTHIRITRFCPGQLHASVDNDGYHYLTFLQNNYPWWKVKVDGHAVPHTTGFKTFITIPLSPGPGHQVEFEFDPWPVQTALQINLLLLALAILPLGIKKVRNWQPIASGTSSHTHY